MTNPEWKIAQPDLADMMYPVRCLHCSGTYSLTHVHVTARYMDCSVWTTPCCGHPGVDDRPDVARRHYQAISKNEATHGDYYDTFGLRRRW